MVFSYMVIHTDVGTINKSWGSDFFKKGSSLLLHWKSFCKLSSQRYIRHFYLTNIHNNVINSLCIYHYIDSVLQEALVYTSAVKWL